MQKPSLLRPSLQIGATPIMLKIAKVVPRGICPWDNVAALYIRWGLSINNYHATPLFVSLPRFCDNKKDTFHYIIEKKFSEINTTNRKIDAVKVSHFIWECEAHWPLLSPRSLTDEHVATQLSIRQNGDH